ncbi:MULTISPECIES: hypothetical protein [unclassified Iodidimonas]|jgi:hypothetical protein|uniref:hypothetical protein n=1 Tax=unclassified Iodidimonas TaxID=2626145 RepID=UPI0024821B9D|nr:MULTISPECIES: hypothetical protein [unclassified Iodidimonas]
MNALAAEKGHAIVRGLISDMEAASWFAAVGEPPTKGETTTALAYLKGLGFSDCALFWIADWAEARAAAERSDWSQRWWQREQTVQSELYAAAMNHLGDARLLPLLTEITDSATRLLHGPAAVAAARSGHADAGIIRAAAGSAAQSCYQMALYALAPHAKQDGQDHPFVSKFRLFEAGRWPLTIAANTFHIF